jgi:hypothetical protein
MAACSTLRISNGAEESGLQRALEERADHP